MARAMDGSEGVPHIVRDLHAKLGHPTWTAENDRAVGAAQTVGTNPAAWKRLHIRRRIPYDAVALEKIGYRKRMDMPGRRRQSGRPPIARDGIRSCRNDDALYLRRTGR